MTELTPEQEAKCREEAARRYPESTDPQRDLAAMGARAAFRAGAAWSAAQAQKWLPIETAPMVDGQLLLLWVVTDLDAWACIGCYEAGAVNDTTDSTGWLTEDGSYISPTHWMPLPTPPTQPSDKEGGEG